MVDGLIIASFRGCSTVLAIDPDHAESHRVAWRVGRTNLTAEEWEARNVGPAPLAVVGDPASEFCAQHAAQVLPNGNLLLFDNGVHCVVNPWTGEFVGRTNENYYSRGVEYALDHANGEAVFVRDHSLRGAQQYLGNSQGHVDPLANGDWLISWGRARRSVAPDAPEVPIEAVTQVDPDTGEEKFSLRDPDNPVFHPRAIPLHPVGTVHRPRSAGGGASAQQRDIRVPPRRERRPTGGGYLQPAGGRLRRGHAFRERHGRNRLEREPVHRSGRGGQRLPLQPHPRRRRRDHLQPRRQPGLQRGRHLRRRRRGVDRTSLCPRHRGPRHRRVRAGDLHGRRGRHGRGCRDPQRRTPGRAGDHGARRGGLRNHGFGRRVQQAPSVTFAAGERTKTFTLTINQDAIDDDDEYVQLEFGALPAGVSGGATSETRVSITDDDDPHVTVSFGSLTYAVAEGGSVRVLVNLDVDPERTIAIPITVANQAGASGGDYGGVPSTVTFNREETTKDFTLTATQDSIDDDGEGLKLGFGTLPARVRAGSPDETTVSIDDDDVPAVTVRFEQDAYTVAENSDVSVRVLLNAVPERAVTIPLVRTELGGATSSDYSGVPDSVTFNSGETEQTIPFVASDDGEDDDGESVRMSFGPLPERVTGGGITRTDIVSQTTTCRPSARSSGAASYEVAEGGDAVIALTLSAEPDRTITIPVTAILLGGASDADYSLTTSALTFSSGQTERTLTLSATQDREDDNFESVLLTLGTLPTGVGQGSTSQTSVEIIDDDVTVSFGAAGYAVAEGAGVTVDVTLSEDPVARS